MSIDPAVLLLAVFPMAMYVLYVALLKDTL